MTPSTESATFQAITEKRVATGNGAILVDAARVPQADRSLLDPTRWPTLDRHGRGAVRRVQGAFGAGILRTYRRGGLIARFTREHYLWTGENQTRPFREFRLLAGMRALQLPVPSPLAAGYSRSGPFYRASLLTAEVPHAATLAERLPAITGDAPLWRSLGSTLARFHSAGFWHADLNAHNLLLAGDREWWLIDFDRGTRRRPDASWPQTRLSRLRRSLRKLGAERLGNWPEVWQLLVDAHDAALGRALHAQAQA
jgi:3-deoxy-D-manno-octulosonic acid kinase